MTINPGWPVYVALVVLLAGTVAANRAARLGLGRDAVVAGLRAVIQLTVAAAIITLVVRSIWWSVAALMGMFVMAVMTTCRRVEARHAWPWAAAAMACGIAPVLAILLATRTIPIEGIALIPVVGIVLGNTMTVHTLVGRRSFAALREERDQYEACLSLGMLPHQAIDEIIARRVPEGLLPSLDQVRTSGLVTLPGAFIGVMLGGGSAVQAATAQVLVLFAIMATQAITAGVQARLIRARRLVPTDLAASLVS
ncbi:MAG: ABC transporter permease [Intrasporangium sp.]|uniref:ABC transporter permease n=1 Tax=Intrasporangium sp. TaxID=1925024 RepID=UPI0026482D73|nr:ABC transporter permease [Intrasporangium sp.]MDN5795010.1 ABC transporter permease [Intrasporangium sp.]